LICETIEVVIRVTEQGYFNTLLTTQYYMEQKVRQETILLRLKPGGDLRILLTLQHGQKRAF